MAGVESLYAGMLGELFNSDPMQLIRKIARIELRSMHHMRFYDLYLGSRRPRYKRKNRKKKTTFKGGNRDRS